MKFLLILIIILSGCHSYKEKPIIYKIHNVTEYKILKELKEIKETQQEILFNQQLKDWNNQRSKY